MLSFMRMLLRVWGHATGRPRAAYHTRTPERTPYRGGKRGVPWLHTLCGVRYAMPHRVSTPPEQGSPRYGGDRIEPVASFGNRSKLLKSWKKTATSAVMAAAAHGPENVAITRIPVPHSGSESHAFFSAHRSRLMLWPAPCAEAHSVCATKNSQPVMR